MNKLKIPNPESIDIGEMFGIPQERRDAISEGLNQMIKQQTNTSPPRLVFGSSVIQYIESLCETDEERIWAIALHLQWNFRTGRMATSERAQNAMIDKYGKPGRL